MEPPSREVLAIANEYGVPVSKYYELRFHIIGKVIAGSCHYVGWFMPIYFAGRLERECVRIHPYERLLQQSWYHYTIRFYEMGIKEREHEDYFLAQVKDSKLLHF